MNEVHDRSKSLQELEGDDWGEPSFDSHLVVTVHRLRRKPIGEYSIEDLRVMIGQGFGLPYLIPLAVERLEEDPLAAGDMVPGDLLQAVLRVGEELREFPPAILQPLRKIVGRAREMLATLDEPDRSTVRNLLAKVPRALKE